MTIIDLVLLIIVVIIALLIGIFKRSGSGPRTTPWWAKVRTCPHCMRKIDARATACPFCGRDVPATG
jgi:hypothetical protein